MALSFVGSSGFVSGTGALSVAVPAGTQSGDLVMCFVNTAKQGINILPQFDGTETFYWINGTRTDSTGAWQGTGSAGSAGAVDMGVSYHWYTSGTNVTYADSGSYQTMVVVTLRGVDTTTPFSGVDASSGTNTRYDAAATTTCTLPVTTAPSANQWLCHAIGLDRDSSSNPYTAFNTLPSNGIGGVYNIFPSGTHTFYDGAITNAGTGGGLWGLFYNSNFNNNTAGSFVDSTTHAYVSFYVNPAPVHATLTTNTGNATAGSAQDGYLLAATDLLGGYANTVVDQGTSWTNPTNSQGSPNSTFANWQSTTPDSSSSELRVTAFSNINTIPSGVTLKYVRMQIRCSMATGGLTSVTGYLYSAGAVLEETKVNSNVRSTGGSWDLTLVVANPGTITVADVQGGLLAGVVAVHESNAGLGGLYVDSWFVTVGYDSASGAATFSTLTGDATAAGQQGALTATRSPTFSTLTGNASAAGVAGALKTDVVFSATTTGNATAAGVAGALKGDATFSATTLGNATAAGQQGAITGVRNATFSTLTGSAAAAGVQGAVTGGATLSATTPGNATAAGQQGALKADVVFPATGTGNATAAGEAGALKGAATFAATTLGNAAAAGETGALTASAGQVDATLTTLTGSATGAGQPGALTGGATLAATTLGNATAAGQAGAVTGGATLATTTGTAAAAGESGALTGVRSPTLATLTGDATATGQQGALTGVRSPTFTTLTGDATAAGGTGAITAAQNVTLETLTGSASSAGEAGALTATRNPTLETLTGSSSAAGEAGSLTGGALLEATGTGSAAAAGGTGAITGTTSIDATLTTLTGNAPAAGLSGSLTGAGVLTTATGDAAAGGQAGALTGVRNATLATLTGNATAAGGTGGMTGEGQTATMTTETGNATAGGRLGTMWTTSVVTDQVTAYGGSASGAEWIDPANAQGAPNDTYATWTSSVDGDTSPDLVIASFGAWASIPAGATVNSVDVAVQHHESHTGAPIASVTGQAYLGSTPLGSPSSFTLSLTDRDDTVNPTLTLEELQGGTLAMHVAVARTGG